MKKIEIFSRYSAAKINAAQGKAVETVEDIPYSDQLKMLNQAYLNEATMVNSTCKTCEIRQKIKKKITGYKAQDKKWEDRIIKEVVSEEDVLEKLVAAKLRCKYCAKEMKILYTTSRDPRQWTLDRINNDLGHTSNNTVVSCMACNLQKRRRSDEAFTFTKKLKINKQLPG